MKGSILFIISFLAFFSFSQEDLEVIIQTGHAGKINSLLYAQGNTKIISAGTDAKIVIWDVKTGKQEIEIIAHNGPVNKIEMYDESTIISCSDDSTVKLIDLKTLDVKKVIGPFEYKVKSIAVNQKNKNIAVGTRFLHLINNNFQITTLKAMSFDHFNAVHYMDEHGYIIYGGRKDKFARVIQEDNLDIIKSIQVNATSIDSFEDEFVIGDQYGALYYYNTRTLKEKRYCLPSALITVNDVSLFENKILIARSDGIVEQLLKKTFITYGYFKGHLSEVSGIDFGLDKSSFISSDVDGNIIVWNDKTKRMSKLLKGEANPINVAKFDQTEDGLLIGYSNGILRKINLISNNVISNRLYFSERQKLDGWKYSIISLDEQIGDTLHFKALKTKTFEENTKNLAFCEIWSGEWDLKKNQIRLNKQILKKKSQKLIYNQAQGQNINWKTYFLNVENHKTPLSINDNYLEITGDIIKVHNSKNNTEIATNAGHSDLITGLDYNKKYNVAISYSWDGSIRFWNTSDMKPISDLYLTGQRDFLWLNPQSYYFSSKGALENIAFSWKGNVFPFDQFDVKYNRPDLIYQKLPFLDSSIVLAMNKAYHKRLKKLGIKIEDIKISADLPKLEVFIPNEEIAFKESITLSCNASDKLAPIRYIKVYVNGVPLKDEALIINKPQKNISKTVTVPLNSGDNIIEVYAINLNGLKSLKESFSVESEKKEKKPNLYIATIGVSNYAQEKYNLNYAEKDSRDIINKLSKAKFYKNIYTKNLSNQEATKDQIYSLIEFVKKADYKDVVIIYAAGHGVLNENLDYFFASYDMDFLNPETKGIPFETFEHILEETKSRKKLLLLDACHSGELDKDEIIIDDETVEENQEINFRAVGKNISVKDGEKMSSFELSRMLFADTRESNGATVISSASGTEFAMEGESWKNGVFTYSFIHGINSKEADLNRDGEILLSEMQTYLNIKVLELTSGKQSPNSRVENLKSDFRLW